MLATLTALITIVLADPAGDAWLERIDKTAHIEEAHLVLALTVTDARGRTHARTIEIWQKGDTHRLVRMVAPARLAGIGLLVSPGGQTHLFLPQYPPARRVIGSKRADAFMGTDFAIEDLSRLTYADAYTATVQDEADDLTHLVLHPIDAPEAAHIDLWVGPDSVVRRVAHHDANGRISRTLELSDVRDVAGVRLPHQIRVHDTQRNRVTHAQIQHIDTDAGIDDAIFSVTQLERR